MNSSFEEMLKLSDKELSIAITWEAYQDIFKSFKFWFLKFNQSGLQIIKLGHDAKSWMKHYLQCKKAKRTTEWLLRAFALKIKVFQDSFVTLSSRIRLRNLNEYCFCFLGPSLVEMIKTFFYYEECFCYIGYWLGYFISFVFTSGEHHIYDITEKEIRNLVYRINVISNFSLTISEF